MSAVEPVRDRRSGLVWLTASLLVGFGLLGAALSVLIVPVVSVNGGPGTAISTLDLTLVIVGVVLGLGEAVSGVFVLIGKEWARRLAIVVCVVNGLSGLITLVASEFRQPVFGIFVNIALIALLLRYEVSVWCR